MEVRRAVPRTEPKRRRSSNQKSCQAIDRGLPRTEYYYEGQSQ